MDGPIFSYWDRADQAPIARFVAEWRGAFPHFRILDDSDVEAMLEQHFPDSVDMFRSIRIPTCKSDIAILVGLYGLGGLYIDCHCGIGDVHAVLRLLADAGRWEVVLYNKNFESESRPPDALRPLNSVIVARRLSPLMRESAVLAMHNLRMHWEAEQQTSTHVPYDIWTMTGPGVLEHTICVPPKAMWGLPGGLRPDLIGKVNFIQESRDAPIVRYRHYSYGSPGTHWSERQKRERLFRDEMTGGAVGASPA